MLVPPSPSLVPWPFCHDDLPLLLCAPFSLLEDSTMYGSVPQYDGRVRVWVRDAFAHLKGASICLMYDCPKRL